MPEQFDLIALDCVTTAFEMFLVHMYLNVFFEMKPVRRIRLSGYAVFGAALVMLSFVNTSSYLMLGVTLAGTISISALLFDGPVFAHAFASFMFCVLAVLMETLGSKLVAAATVTNITGIFEYGILRIISSVLASFLILAAIKVIGVFIKKKAGKTLTQLWKLTPLLIFPVFSIILLLIHFNNMVDLNKRLSVSFFLEILALAYMNVMVFWYYDRIIRSYEIRHENELMQIKTSSLLKYYELAQLHQERLVALTHDISKHVKVMEGLAGDLRYSQEYLRDYKKSLNGIGAVVQTPDPVVNVILSECITRALEIGVEPEIEVVLPEKFDIDPIDITVILGNTIENALRVLADMPQDAEKSLTILLRQRGNFLLYEIKNSYVANASAATRAGYGLRNVKACVKKYCGDLVYGGDDRIYTTRAILQFPR